MIPESGGLEMPFLVKEEELPLDPMANLVLDPSAMQ